MARVRDQVTLTQDVIADAAQWYRDNRVPVPFRVCHPKVLRRALALAGHDWRRMTVEDDGSITIHNGHVWTA